MAKGNSVWPFKKGIDFAGEMAELGENCMYTYA
jgi:hypothetical protein